MASKTAYGPRALSVPDTASWFGEPVFIHHGNVEVVVRPTVDDPQHVFLLSGVNLHREPFLVLVEQHLHFLEPSVTEVTPFWLGLIEDQLRLEAPAVARGSRGPAVVRTHGLGDVPPNPAARREPAIARFIGWFGSRLRASNDQRSLAKVARAILDGAPEKSPWAESLGPLYTIDGLAANLDWTSQEVRDAEARNQLLAVRSSEDILLFPAGQVTASGNIVTGLPWILRRLDHSLVDRYTLAGWLNARREEDGDRSIWMLLGDSSELTERVRSMVCRWRSVLER